MPLEPAPPSPLATSALLAAVQQNRLLTAVCSSPRPPLEFLEVPTEEAHIFLLGTTLLVGMEVDHLLEALGMPHRLISSRRVCPRGIGMIRGIISHHHHRVHHF